ncbi:MAG: addiction module antidote protein family [Phycisphaerales bacterium]|nr:addiction module antidote protein family [Phycisphaerales bacterium]
MRVSVNPAFEAFVQRLIASGKYGSAAEVVSDALSRLQEDEPVQGMGPDRFRREVAAGLAAAERGELMDGSVVMSEIRAKSDRMRSRTRKSGSSRSRRAKT